MLIYWLAAALLMVASFVWAMMLLGAWVYSLENPGRLGFLALREQFASPIMRAKVRELVTLIGAFGLLVLNSVSSISLNNTIDKTASGLLCEVRGMSTPTPVKDGIKLLSQSGGRFDATLKAYGTFLDDPTSPDKAFIKMILPQQKSAFDFRLLGLINDMLAVQEEDRQYPRPETVRKYLKDAWEAYKQALAFFQDPNFKLPGNPPDEMTSDFKHALESNLASVHLGYGKFSEGSERKDYLTKARDECDRLVREWGKRPGIYINLLSADSLLLENETAEDKRKLFQEAIDVLSSVPARKNLTPADKTSIKTAMSNWESEVKEIRALVNHFEKERYPLTWNKFVEQIFHGSAQK